MLGNPLPLAENPVRLAEELAMIDMISKGRLVSGFVRGGGQEQLATGVNPAFNRERFEEAHDLIVKAWTQPGAVPLGGHALPAPRRQPVGGAAAEAAIRASGSPACISKETIIWAAQQRYPYIALNTVDRARPRRSGSSTTRWRPRPATPAGPENRGYLKQVHVAETEEKAIENARQFMWMQGEFTGLAHPVWSTPSGYFSPGQPPRLRRVRGRPRRRTRAAARPSRSRSTTCMIIAGTPKTVIAKLRRLLEETRPGILALWGNDGTRQPRGRA